MITASTVVDAWNAFNSFLPLSTLVVIFLSGAVVAYGLRQGLGLFRRGVK